MTAAGRWWRKRLVANAALLVQARVLVGPDTAIEPEVCVEQEWDATGSDREWLEAFMPVAFAVKIVSNFRGDAALEAWTAVTGETALGELGPTERPKLVRALDDHAGTYNAQIFRPEHQLPFIQTSGFHYDPYPQEARELMFAVMDKLMDREFVPVPDVVVEAAARA
jgi:hypothetical protein